MSRRMFVCSVLLAVAAVLILFWWFSKNPAGENLAWLMIIAYLAWLSTVLISFSRTISAHPDYRRFFETNERRWCWLAGLTFTFFVFCLFVGWGQPLVRGVEEGFINKVRPLQSSEITLRSQNVLATFSDKLLKHWQLDGAGNVIGWNKPVRKEALERAEKRRNFYGLRSWSHWFILVLLYLPTLLFYGVAARREEFGEWIEQKRRERDERRQATPVAVPTGARRNWVQILDTFVDFIDLVTGIGTHLGKGGPR